MDPKTQAIGIDLGTTYSCVAVWQHQRVEIIANEQGNKTTPSCVAFDQCQRMIGEAAKNQATVNPINTIFDAKRLIGKKFNDDHVQSDMKLWPFRVIESHDQVNKPIIVVTYKNREMELSAEEISSIILSKMKQIAEAYLGSKVENAIVTVPAYFNDSQRQATKDSGTIAGLNVLRIFNEPTAAAIAYGIDKMTPKNKELGMNVLVFDLGGGTFDVSLLRMGKDSYVVIGVTGDTHLGGGDFDNRMVNHFVAEFKRKHNRDISGNLKALGRLRASCERAKRLLSSTKETSIDIDCLFDSIDFKTNMTRAKFERLNEDLFVACMELVEECLCEAKMKREEIDEVVLVGGSTRIVKIQEMLKEFFNGKEPCISLNPDEAVASGAAILAATLTGTRHSNDFKLVDVNPLSLGIKLSSNTMKIYIPRNTSIPTKNYGVIKTTEDNQTSVPLEVYEGERPFAGDNNFIGKFYVSGVPAAPKGVQHFNVCFEIDDNGILTVSAQHIGTNNKNQITISNQIGRLSKEQIEQMVKEAEMHKLEDEKNIEVMEAKVKLESYTQEIWEKVKLYSKDFLNGGSKALAEAAIREIMKWLDPTLHVDDREFYEEKLSELRIMSHELIDRYI